MNANFKTLQDVESFFSSFDRHGLTGRELMKAMGQELVMSILEVRGATKLFAEFCGFANPGVVSVATADLGWRVAGTRGSNSGGNGNVKIKGTLPYKTAFAIARVHGEPDPEEFEPSTVTWQNFKDALEVMGADWLELLYKRLGGKESDGGKSFTAWIESNTAKDEADKRAADPVYQLKENNRKLLAMLTEKDKEVEKLKNDILDLENMMRSARRGNGNNHGGVLTSAMKKLMQQRFHPDKQNGNDETMYTTLSQWINALEVVD